MVKLINQLIGAKVLLFQERVRIGEIKDVIINPKDGAFVGFEILEEPKGEIKYIPPSEIKGLGSGFVLVKDLNSLSEKDDVVKIKKALQEKPVIISSKVYTEEGEYLGKVEDATIDFKLSSLERLYVTPKLSIKFLSENLVIAASQIIKVEKKKIIVKNGSNKVKSLSLDPNTVPLTE